jgi:hypothetical protein
MLVTGICTLEKFEAYRKRRWPRRCISYGLLRHASESALGRELFETVVWDLEFSSGICRTTRANRFADADALLLSLLETRGAPAEIHDWAASDCISSCELAGKVFERFPATRVTASDVTFHIVSARDASRREEFFFEESGHPLQYVRPPFVIPLNRPAPRLGVVNRVMRSRALARAREIARGFPPPEGDSTGSPAGWRFSRVSLIHPCAAALTPPGAAPRPPRDPRFRIAVHSIFDRLQTQAGVIRTMNILNCCYFNSERIVAAAAAVFHSLREGGLWMVGRTGDDGRNSVTVFEKRMVRFEQVAELNGGSEAAPIARDAVFPAAQAASL